MAKQKSQPKKEAIESGIDLARFFKPANEIMPSRTLLKRIETELKVDEKKAAQIYAYALADYFIEPGPMVGILENQPTIKLGRPGLLKI